MGAYYRERERERETHVVVVIKLGAYIHGVLTFNGCLLSHSTVYRQAKVKYNP